MAQLKNMFRSSARRHFAFWPFEPAESMGLAPGSAVIEHGDATWLPGFIDAHTHLGWAYSASYDQREMERMRKTFVKIALDATVWVRKMLMAGFTTVRDLGSTDFIDIGLQTAIADGRRLLRLPVQAVRFANRGLKTVWPTGLNRTQLTREEIDALVDGSASAGPQGRPLTHTAARAPSERYGLGSTRSSTGPFWTTKRWI